VPAAVRAAQIAANMERWRWLPPQFEAATLSSTFPTRACSTFHDGKVLLKSNVVVGRKTSASPIIRTEIKTVVVNPPWNIPGDIAARDLLPHLKRNANYLATRNMVVMDWPKGDPRGRTINGATSSRQSSPTRFASFRGRPPRSARSCSTRPTTSTCICTTRRTRSCSI
jgi:murein L,D-transpeptidase YcbB/YkuD